MQLRAPPSTCHLGCLWPQAGGEREGCCKPNPGWETPKKAKSEPAGSGQGEGRDNPSLKGMLRLGFMNKNAGMWRGEAAHGNKS